MDWDRKFSEPIVLPRGKKLATLRDAALYITKLPKAEHDAEEWQAAMQALLLVAEHDGPTMFARIGVMRALNRLGGILYMARTAIWRGPLSGPGSSRPVRDTLEPPLRSVRFLGLGTNWPGILLMAIGAVLLVSRVSF
jgi:hypothetical protein